MNEYFEGMREQLERHEQSQVRGLSTRDVVAQSYDEADLLKLAAELKERASFEDATFRFCSFIYERQDNRIPEAIRHLVADCVADHVSALATGMDPGAVEIFVAWGGHRHDHTGICVKILDHPQAWIRKIALIYSGSFLPSSDYAKLFKFRHDPEVSEIAMGGPLRFMLRDQALDVLKRLTKCPVVEGDCFEQTPDGNIYYRSWTPFLNWFERKGS